MKPCQLYVVKKKEKEKEICLQILFTLSFTAQVIELKTAVSRIKSD